MDVIFCFSKPVAGSTVASSRIALFLADVLKLPIYYSADIGTVKADNLIIVNGAFAFCGCLAELGKAIYAAKRVVWVQNDYTIVPPKSESNAQSPFRKAFVDRAAKGKEPMRFWTTVEKNVGTYINWNSLTYEPQPSWLNIGKDLFYYGAFRQQRQSSFDTYFRDPVVPVTISSTSKKFEVYAADNVSLMGGMERDMFYMELGLHGLGLYIEDDKSHMEFHSPANRFYEMLSAGLPMVFQPECVEQLYRAGYDVRPYVAPPARLPSLLRKRQALATQQAAAWGGKALRKALRAAVTKAYKELQQS